MQSLPLSNPGEDRWMVNCVSGRVVVWCDNIGVVFWIYLGWELCLSTELDELGNSR